MRRTLFIILFVFACSLLVRDSARAADIPSLGSGALPRVMIIFDNSLSMVLKPDDQFGDLTWQFDDYDPDNNPAASCQNKFCIAKKVLSTTLPAYSSLTQMGLATYYQYLKTDLIPVGGGTTDCTYDVLAAPGELFTFTTDTNNGASFSCTPLACSEPPKSCTLQYQDPFYYLIQWFSPARGSAVGSSSFVDSGRTYTLRSITQEPPGAPYDWFMTPEPCPTPKVLDSTYAETSNWGCSATNPCTMFYKDQLTTSSTLALVFYQNQGPTYTSGGVTYTLVNSTLEQYPIGSPPCQTAGFTDTSGLAPGCSTSSPCDFTYLRTDTSPVYQDWFTDQGPSFVSSGTTFTKTGTTVQGPFEVQLTAASPTCQTAGYTETGNWGCSSSNPCAMTYTGIRVQSGEITTQYCQYNRTDYTYSANVSSCVYQRTTYTYAAPGGQTTYCQYARQSYNFYASAYVYQWTTQGGEMVDSTTVRADNYSNWCPGGGYAGGFGPSRLCPPRADNIGDPCTVGSGRACLLQWRTPLTTADGGTIYPQGRISGYLGSNPSVPTGCLAPDRPDGGALSQPDPGLYVNDWCTGIGTALTTRVETRLQSDYYDPSQNNPPSFPMAKKYSGWSRAEDGSKTPSQTFIDMGPNTMSQILQALKKYYSISAANPNTAGIRTAQNDEAIDYTPLYGSLTNAQNYLSNMIDNDPDYACRPYWVLMITDGQEYTPKNYTATDLQNAVTALRNIHTGGNRDKDVKTFVIGFGNKAIGGPLDLMARAGGTAVNPTTLKTDLVNGVALSAMSGAALKTQLDLVFSALVAGAYSRSKPLLALNGSRIYAGYFSLVPDSLEWQGNLDAFNLTPSGGISSIWRYAPQLDGQSSRTIYTKVRSNSSLIYFDTQASGSNPIAADQSNLYTAMNTDPVSGDKAITFLRNISKAEAFMDGSIKSSRASDIYHSNPAIVGTSARSANWGGRTTAEQNAYQTYKTSTASREVEVYVGANDAMLHAIREDPATTPQSWAGSEKWAYVPPGALQKIVANRNGHTFSVDGSFGIDDVCSPPCALASDWKTILVGSMREGGPSLYALDVSDPVNPRYLWDYNDGNLGNTWSAPVIGRVTVSTSSGPQDKWAVFVGGGMSAAANRGNYFTVVDALSGTAIVDNASTVAKFKVDLGFPLPENNLPSRPSLYRPQDGAFVKTVYFGDTQGRLNRMDVSGTSVASWAPVRFFDPADTACKADIFGNAAAPIKLPDGTQVGTLPLPSVSAPPAIYDRAIVAQDPNGRRMVFVGTGDTTNPTSPTDINYFYAVRDSDTGTICSGIPAWIKKFAPGEKVISDAVVVGNAVILSTYRPPPSSSGCNQAGSATLYAFDMVKGTPAAALKDSLGNNVSQLVIPNAGITSDLQVSGGNLVFNTSNKPNQPQAVALNVGGNVQVRSWKKVR